MRPDYWSDEVLQFRILRIKGSFWPPVQTSIACTFEDAGGKLLGPCLFLSKLAGRPLLCHY